jgi:hypothetical protein
MVLHREPGRRGCCRDRDRSCCGGAVVGTPSPRPRLSLTSPRPGRTSSLRPPAWVAIARILVRSAIPGDIPSPLPVRRPSTRSRRRPSATAWTTTPSTWVEMAIWIVCGWLRWPTKSPRNSAASSSISTTNSATVVSWRWRSPSSRPPGLEAWACRVAVRAGGGPRTPADAPGADAGRGRRGPRGGVLVRICWLWSGREG